MSRALVATDATAIARAYEKARTAIAELKAIPLEGLSIDEALAVDHAAELIQVTALQARDRQMEIDAVEIRMRAERHLGELIVAQKKHTGLARGAAAGGRKAGPRGTYTEPRDTAPKLSELGVDKKLSSSSQQLAAIPPAAFEKKLTAWRGRLEHGTERVSRAIVRDESKGERRADRERELADRIKALPSRKFGVIYADPEWRFEPRSRTTGLDRSADNHYPTSSTEQIAMRPVDEIAADDCVLFLWATAPMLPDALRVMAAWGFTYKSQIVWRKAARAGAGVVIGTGYWFRNAHELLLVGTRGDVPAPEQGTQSPSIVDAPPLKHSEKPELFYELVEQYFPNLPKIELNARRRRPGWDAWGLEAPELVELAADKAATCAGDLVAPVKPRRPTRQRNRAAASAVNSEILRRPPRGSSPKSSRPTRAMSGAPGARKPAKSGRALSNSRGAK